MSRAEQRAKEKYWLELNNIETQEKYAAYVDGYRQAEKDLADAFIEKARKWFEKRNEWHDINGIKHCDMEDFEDFKKYMEGE